MQDFKGLMVWRKAHALYLNVFRLVRGMPRATPASMKSQIHRAADSIVSNIVEGSGAASKRDFARFLDMTIKSCCELEGHLIKARDLGLVGARSSDILCEDAVEVRKMSYGLRRRLLTADKADLRRIERAPSESSVARTENSD